MAWNGDEELMPKAKLKLYCSIIGLEGQSYSVEKMIHEIPAVQAILKSVIEWLEEYKDTDQNAKAVEVLQRIGIEISGIYPHESSYVLQISKRINVQNFARVIGVEKP